MRYVSVCSGIEAATVAWHDLGFTPVLFSDIEAFPCAVLQHHFPDVPLVGDFTTLIANPPDADLLVGGTPCQAFSIAGGRKSLDDYRGNLSLAFADLAHAMDVPYVLWENVPGVLSTKDNAFGCFLARLVGADSPILPGGKGKWARAGVVSGPQRTAAWRVLDAQYLGVAQRRQRVFVLSARGAGNYSCASALFPLCEGVCGDTAPRRETGQSVAGTLSARPTGGGGLGTDFDLAGGVVPVLMRQREGKPGGGKGPLLSASVRLTLAANTNDQVLFVSDVAPSSQHPVESLPAIVGALSDGAHNGGGLNGQDVYSGRIFVDPYSIRVRRLTPRECERLQGFPDDYTLIPWKKGFAKDGLRYRALGNSMAVPVMRWIGKRIREVYEVRHP